MNPITMISAQEAFVNDEARILTYRRALFLHKDLVKNKVVLQLNAQCGLFAMYAIRCGAIKVFAVEEDFNAAEATEKIIQRNGYSDSIQVIHGCIDDIELPVPVVDVIINDCVGDCIFSMSGIAPLLRARDKYLAPGGILMPDTVRLYLCGIEDEFMKRGVIDYWNTDIYGFDMSVVRKEALKDAEVRFVNGSQVVTDSCHLQSFDLMTLTLDDCRISSVPFTLHAKREDIVHSLITFFVVEFSACHKRTGFSTSPEAPPTGWRQTVFYLDKIFALSEGDTISGTFSLEAQEREDIGDLEVEIAYTVKQCYCKPRSFTQSFTMF